MPSVPPTIQPWFIIEATIYDINTGLPLKNTPVNIYGRAKDQEDWTGPITVQTDENGVLRYEQPAQPYDMEIKIEHPQDSSIYKIIDVYMIPEMATYH